MDKQIKEELEDIALHEELMNMSVEEIMEEGHFNRETAEAIYDANHGINMGKSMNIKEFYKWLDDIL